MQHAGDSSPATPERGLPPSAWDQLAERLNPGYERPKLCGDIVASRLESVRGEPYYIVKNPHARTYVRLAPDEYFVLRLIDGQRQVKDLVLAHFFEYRCLALRRILDLVAQLKQNRFFVEQPRDAWNGLVEQLARRTWTCRIDRLLKAFLNREFDIRGIDGAVTTVHRRVGWLFFTRPAALLLVLLAIVGALLFSWELVQSGRDPMHFDGSAGVGLWTLLCLALVVLSIHEAGHALATKASGREVNRGGFMIYYGMPAFFVDTTDIWMEPRRARIVVSAAGMAAVWALGGLAMLFVLFQPASPLAGIAFQLAFVAFVNNSLNLLPLLELDGYYLLMDWLELPLLRARALAFVRHDLLRKLRARESFSSEERVFAAFGVLAITCSVYILGAAVYFWLNGLRQLVVEAWTRDSPLLRGLVVLVLFAAAVPLTLAAAVKLHQMAAQARGGLARLRHRREEARAQARLEARELLGGLRFLAALNFAEREEIVRHLRAERYRPGEYVVREGEPGAEFYIIRSGQAEVTKLSDDGWSRRLTILRHGDYFGELALLYQEPRQASVRALARLDVFVLDRTTFDAAIAPRLRDYGLTVQLLEERDELSRMSLFQQTSPSDLDPILEHLRAEEFPAGAAIVRQGEPGDRFYLIRRGRVQVTRQAAGGEEELAVLSVGDHFGELALLGDVPRAATVRALDPVVLWSLDRASFSELLLNQLQLRGQLSTEAERREATRSRLAGELAA